jgi:hypothetical protein
MLPYTTPDSKLAKKYDYWDLLDEYTLKQFQHVFDFYIDQRGDTGVLRSADNMLSNIRSADLFSGFVRTFDDNEDPTILGFEIILKVNDSPIFNGELKNFIDTWSGLNNTEIGSRAEILDRFQAQLFKFFKKDSDVNLKNSQNANPKFLNTDGAKSYYLEEIEGLDKLTESYMGISGEGGGSGEGIFVDYPKDVITLKFREDVTQNLAYLASLYKSLSWSRLRGKQLVPENLLRFDCEIVITELKDYVRIFKNGDTIEKYVDKISRYVYELYECQFFFSNMPHGTSLKMNNPETLASTDIKFNYKFATMRFEKMSVDPQDPSQLNVFVIDNKLKDIVKITPKDASNASNNSNSLTLEKSPTKMKLLNGGDNELSGSLARDGREGVLEDIKVNDKLENGASDTNENALPQDNPLALAGVGPIVNDTELNNLGQSVPPNLQFQFSNNSVPQFSQNGLSFETNDLNQSIPQNFQTPLNFSPTQESNQLDNIFGQNVTDDLQISFGPNQESQSNQTNELGQQSPPFQSFLQPAINFQNQINQQNSEIIDSELQTQMRLMDRTLANISNSGFGIT